MTHSSKKNQIWYLVIINDAPRFLPGRSIVDMIKFLQKNMGCKFIATRDLQGSGISSLLEVEGDVIPIDSSSVIEKIDQVIQFDWGDFFLFNKVPNKWVCDEYENYPLVIAKTDSTIRAVDDQYIYIYTPSNQVVDEIQKNYLIESVKMDFLSNLEYPY